MTADSSSQRNNSVCVAQLNDCVAQLNDCVAQLKSTAQLKRTALSVIRSHCRVDGSPIDDQDIYNGLQSCLGPIQVDGVVVHFGANGLWQVCFSLDREIHGRDILKHLIDLESLQQRGCKFGSFKMAGEDISFMQSTVENLDVCKGQCGDEPHSCKCGHSLDDIFLLLNPKQKLFGNPQSDTSQSNEHWYVIFMTLREVFLRRNHAYRHFPQELSRRYWEKVSLPTDSPEEAFLPPWVAETEKSEEEKTKHEVTTITLSLDLRKSTIAMEQATNPGKFADWMRDLIQKLTEIALEHLAVFDKFTGDGIIVHFLEGDVNRLIPSVCPRKTAMELAVVCAAKMVAEVNQRLDALRKFLQSDFSNLGAAVGLAVGMAKWSSDHTGNPIVVGRGVVGACRSCGAPPGIIRMTNSAYQSYRDTELFKRAQPELMESKSKDFPEDLVVRLWELEACNVLKVVPCDSIPKPDKPEPYR